MRLGQCIGAFLLSFGATMLVGGCGDSSTAPNTAKSTPPAKQAPAPAAATEGGKPAEVAKTKEQEHGEWWCNEHGVPEEVCAQCNATVAADFKKKGDWCKKHDRPDSQCFVCHPELEAKFAAQYEAKYGKKPPKPEAGEGEEPAKKKEAAKPS